LFIEDSNALDPDLNNDIEKIKLEIEKNYNNFYPN
jgi:hypothetical protein